MTQQRNKPTDYRPKPETAQATVPAKPTFILKEGHQVQEVFEIDGIKYYQFIDSSMAPCSRMFTALAYYNELQMRCDKAYLLAHSDAMKALVNAEGPFDRMKAATLILQMQERLQWIIEPETVFNYASVVIFDETESPYEYDMKYNRTVKIPLWKKLDRAAFFLKMPAGQLFPALNLSHADLSQYLEVLEKVDQVHLETIFTTLSSSNKTAASSHIQELLKRRVLPSQKSSDGLSGSTTSS